jgi:hypothetical protein
MMLLAEDEDEEEEENLASVAKFVEPPELPTLLIHKVFGKRRYVMFLCSSREFVVELSLLSLSRRANFRRTTIFY